MITITINDKEYTLQEALEAVWSGEISEAAYDGAMQALDYEEET